MENAYMENADMENADKHIKNSCMLDGLPCNRFCLPEKFHVPLKCHCNEKIFDPILNTTEQHFQTSLDGVFSFSISCFVLEILRFLKHAN